MRHGEEVSLPSSSKISNLDPFIDENEVLRVGGRIKRSNLNTEYIHPILLSGKGIFFFYQIIQFTLCKQTKSIQYRN